LAQPIRPARHIANVPGSIASSCRHSIVKHRACISPSDSAAPISAQANAPALTSSFGSGPANRATEVAVWAPKWFSYRRHATACPISCSSGSSATSKRDSSAVTCMSIGPCSASCRMSSTLRVAAAMNAS